jgi:predicted metal-dependent phosphoesterase TrpH
MTKKRKTTKIDLHIHTRGSDGMGSPKDIVKYALAAGLDGVCLTDHHFTYTPESLDVAAALRGAGILVIHGCEYSTAQGHLLVFGVNIEDLKLGYYPDMQKVIDEVNRRGGVAIPAHPYKGYRRRLENQVKRLRGVRAYEVANGQCTYQKPSANAQAVKAAKETRKLTTGGSDAHNPRDIGLTYTEFQGVITCEYEFIQSLKQGQFRAVTSRKRVEAELSRRYSLARRRVRARSRKLDDLLWESHRFTDLDRTAESRQVPEEDAGHSRDTLASWASVSPTKH